MKFEIIFSPKSYKQIKQIERFDKELKQRIKEASIEICNDPWHKGTIKVKGYGNIMRKRVGNYRILYSIDRGREEVLVVKTEKRSETAYK